MIQIRCKNNKKSQKVAIGSTLFDIFSEFGLQMDHGPISCKVNNKVEGLRALQGGEGCVPCQS